MQHSRRAFLRLLAASGGSLALACLPSRGEDATPIPPPPRDALLSITPMPTPTPPPARGEPVVPVVYPAGVEHRVLLAGTPYETPAVIRHSGSEGVRLMILGGVHGNEPGGWLAAEEIAEWSVSHGSLIVVPRANVEATLRLVRTTDELGDLNRLYPGSQNEAALPMQRMAWEIVALAREFHVDRLLDLHESWAFYRTRNQSGTAFLGQTISLGSTRPSDIEQATRLVETINAAIPRELEQFIYRTRGGGGSGGGGSFNFGGGGRGGSSTSLGQHIPGLVPYLVEMGQEGQAVERRAELHRHVVATALSEFGLA